MAVKVTIKNVENLRKLKQYLGAKDENEAVDIALENFVKKFVQNEERKEEKEDNFDFRIQTDSPI